MEKKLAAALGEANKERSLRQDAEVQLCEVAEQLEFSQKQLTEASEQVQVLEADTVRNGVRVQVWEIC